MWWVHPVLGAVVVTATLFLASRGLVARQGGKAAAGARRLHQRLGPWVLGGMWVTLIGGFASTRFFRPELEWFETKHTVGGLVVVLGMTSSWLSTRAFAGRGAGIRTAHLVLGLGVALGAVLQLLLGIPLLP